MHRSPYMVRVAGYRRPCDHVGAATWGPTIACYVSCQPRSIGRRGACVRTPARFALADPVTGWFVHVAGTGAS